MPYLVCEKVNSMRSFSMCSPFKKYDLCFLRFEKSDTKNGASFDQLGRPNTEGMWLLYISDCNYKEMFILRIYYCLRARLFGQAQNFSGRNEFSGKAQAYGFA